MPADVPAPAVEIEKLVGQVCGSLATAPREVVAVLDVSAEEADGLGVVVVAERRRSHRTPAAPFVDVTVMASRAMSTRSRASRCC